MGESEKKKVMQNRIGGKWSKRESKDQTIVDDKSSSPRRSSPSIVT